MEMATIQYKFYANIAVISTNSRFKILKEVLYGDDMQLKRGGYREKPKPQIPPDQHTGVTAKCCVRYNR